MGENPGLPVTQDEIMWGSRMNEYNWKLCYKFSYWTKMHEFELCEVKFWSYKWRGSFSCCIQLSDSVWHFIIKDQEMNITGFVWWSSRLRRRFWFNAWYLKGEKKFKKDVITVQLLFACLYHMKYNTSFLSWADLQQIFIFVFLVILGKSLACLDAQASLNGVPVKLIYYVVIVLRTWIYTASCYYRVNAQHCMEWLHFVKNSNRVTVAIKVAIFCPKLLR